MLPSGNDEDLFEASTDPPYHAEAGTETDSTQSEDPPADVVSADVIHAGLGSVACHGCANCHGDEGGHPR
jgi:hypothetical protein